jgi:hypothetical protein
VASLLLKLADLGFTGRGCYRTGDCERCAAKNLVTWYWHRKWYCDLCVLNTLLPEQASASTSSPVLIEDLPKPSAATEIAA